VQHRLREVGADSGHIVTGDALDRHARHVEGVVGSFDGLSIQAFMSVSSMPYLLCVTTPDRSAAAMM
jgi:hypothetical protein